MGTFIKDLDGLPTDIQKKIITGIKEQIETEILNQKEFNTFGFRNYLQNEIKKATDSMNKLILESNRDGAILETISEIYVWNKERAKILKKYLDNYTQQTVEPSKNSSFTQEQEKRALNEFRQCGTFIMNNTGKEVKDSDFYDMIKRCDFSNIDSNRSQTKLKRLIADISTFFGNAWGEKTAKKSFSCSLDDCKKIPKNNKK